MDPMDVKAEITVGIISCIGDAYWTYIVASLFWDLLPIVFSSRSMKGT